MKKNTDLTEFGDILLKLYRHAHELPINHFQDAALNLVKPVLPFDSSMWGTARTAADGIDVHTLHLFEKSPEMMVDYVPLKQLDTAAAACYAHPRATKGFNSATWWGEPKDREFLEYVQSYDQNNIFITTEHDAKHSFLHWISLFRIDPEAHCRPEEEALLARLSPHLMQALALNRLVHLDRIGPSTVLLRGSAIADLRGVIYHADAHFNAMLRTQWSDWQGHALPDAVLKHFLLGHARYGGDAVVIAQHAQDGMLFLKSRPRCSADGLTPREFTIAQLVAKGRSYKEIAGVLARSPATVRNQIQAIYAKLEVNSIAGLIEALRHSD